MSSSFYSFYIYLSLVVFTLWIMLTGSLAADELLVGAVVSIAVSIATPRSGVFSGFRLTPQAPVALFRYLLQFFIALIKANLDMARRILTPSLPLNPAIVEVKTELQSDLGRLLLANSITLTPGTLTVDVKNDRLLIHWVDFQPGTDLEQITRAIAFDFEQHIKGFMN